tara:strand:- start:62 stop:436 length:375 start_codon:yes stop_codon:yes gene_type:complete
MSHFAEIDSNDLVIRVIVAEQDFMNLGLLGNPNNWIKTSYNTHGGIHINSGTPLRKNFASTGHTYDRERDAFIPPKPYPSWILDENTCNWVAPIEMPDDGKIYRWDEGTANGSRTGFPWKEIEE